MKFSVIMYTVGHVLKVEAMCMLLPVICALCYHENKCALIFLICAFITYAAGSLLGIKNTRNHEIFAKEGFTIVSLSWIMISLLGSLPFIISGVTENPIDAFFETVSGFTTTGASIIKNVEILPKSIIFWRSFTHWIGGMGVLVFLVAIFPLSGGSSFYLLKAESTGPSVGKLVPKLTTTAKLLYGMYILFTAIEFVLLKIGGLPLFDSLTIAFGTAGTGGFGIRNSSIADYSAYLQVVITVFMIIFGVDFSFYYLIFKRKIRSAIKMEEVRVYFAILIIAMTVISFNCFHIYGNTADTVRHSAFQVASIMTTTGYATTDYNLWPYLSKSILILLMFIGGCAGSTGGGMKVSRHIILWKSIVKELKTAAHPKRTGKVTLNSSVVSHETQRSINVFLAAYFVIFAFSVIIICIDNMDFETNFSAVAATLNNIGPGLQMVGPTENYSAFSNLSKIVLIFDMLAGRLELFPMLVLFSPYTWKK